MYSQEVYYNYCFCCLHAFCIFQNISCTFDLCVIFEMQLIHQMRQKWVWSFCSCAGVQCNTQLQSLTVQSAISCSSRWLSYTVACKLKMVIIVEKHGYQSVHREFDIDEKQVQEWRKKKDKLRSLSAWICRSQRVGVKP